jgi:cytochrome c553
MAIQDDIMAMLSQIPSGGNRATDRGRRGEELYGQIADRLSGDNRSKAMREIAMLSGNPEMSIEEQMRYDSLTGSRVADIIEKYMDDAGDGVPAAAVLQSPVPDDMIVDDTRAAEQLIMTAPDTAGAMPRSKPEVPIVRRELPDLPPLVLDEAAEESMARELKAEQPSISEQLVEMVKATGAGAKKYYDETGSDVLDKAKRNIRAEMGLDPVQGPNLNNRDRLRYAEEQGLNAEITRAAAEAARANNMAADEMISTRNFEDVLRAAQGQPERPARRAQTEQARQQEQFINNILMRFNAGEISERQARQMLQRVSPAAMAELEKSGGMMASVPRPYAAPTPPPARMAGGMSVRDKIS